VKNSYKVLIVDDEEELVLTLVERLEFRGIPAKGVMTGKDALAFLRREKFDVVVADLKMPGIDGLEIKSVVERQHPATKVILVTGHGSEDPDQEVDLDDHILMKPFDLSALMQKIGEVLEE
jgi:DNA-binding NtrC family response regulator